MTGASGVAAMTLPAGEQLVITACCWPRPDHQLTGTDQSDAVGAGANSETSSAYALDGAAETTRTSDLLITNQLLYQLSYSSKGAGL